MNYHIGRLVLSLLCVGDLVRLILGGVRFAGCSLRNEHHQIPAATKLELHPYMRCILYCAVNILVPRLCYENGSINVECSNIRCLLHKSPTNTASADCIFR